jgi:N-acetylneuraminate synthase
MTASCLIIAEAGVNHNGDQDHALRLVEAAAATGADAVKFQTFNATTLAAADAPKADYQTAAVGEGSQIDMLRALELSPQAHRAAADRCAALGIEFMSTPFDPDSVGFLCDLGVRRLKIPSGELTNPLLLRACALSGLPLIVSTGMATLNEVDQALGLIALTLLDPQAHPHREAIADAYVSADGRTVLGGTVTVLHCTSEYPAAPETINLRAMDTLARHTGLAVGLSDHSQGIAVPLAAAARGARVVEKHFTLDCSLPGPDQKASLEPAPFTDMVRGIRTIEQALGSAEKTPGVGEQRTAAVARRSLVAARPIAAGQVLTADDITLKRPGTGLSPFFYWDLIGSTARRAYRPDEALDHPPQDYGGVE